MKILEERQLKRIEEREDYGLLDINEERGKEKVTRREMNKWKWSWW